MNISQLIASLETHAQYFPQEKSFVDNIIQLLKKYPALAFHNSHWDDGHITASMLIVNPARTRTLLMFHRKFQKWLQFWGHSDDSPDVLATAVREFHEESGIREEPRIFSYSRETQLPIFDVDIHDIPPDLKWRPNHKHYDIRFLWIIDDDTVFSRQESEVDDIRWFDIEWIEKYVVEKWLLRMFEKIKKL